MPPDPKNLVRAPLEGYRGHDVLASPLSDRFSLLTAALAPREWRWLGAVALEHGLSRGVLLALAGEGADGKVLDAWLKQSVATGLLLAVGPTRALSLTSAPSREPGRTAPTQSWVCHLPSPQSGRDRVRDAIGCGCALT